MTAPDLRRVEAKERDLLERLPLQAEHVPNAEIETYDARLIERFAPTPSISVAGSLVLEPETPLELKSCERWITDRHSNGGRRRGQFRINESTHAELRELGGAYVFVVLSGDDILAGRVVEADQLDDLPYYNTGAKYASRRATLPWPRVIPRGCLP